MDSILAAACVISTNLAVGNSLYGPIPQISFLNRVEISNSLSNVENCFRNCILENISAAQSEQISNLFDVLKKCCTTAVLGIDSRKELVAYLIASLRELAPLVGKLNDYDAFIFIMQLIESQKENAFLIYAKGGFKLVKSSEFNYYKNQKEKRPTDFRHSLEKHHINMTRLPNGKKDNRASNLVNCYFIFHFIAHIITANNEKSNVLSAPRLGHNNNPLGLMSARLFTVFGESKEDRTEREIADRIADTKQISAASKLLREANLTEEQKQKRTTLQKLGEQQRKIKRQEAHDAWLATLSETDRLLARSTPVGPAELSRMTEEEQLASRWLSSTYRVPRTKKGEDPLAKEARKARDKEVAAAKKSLKESTLTEEQKQENKVEVAARLKAAAKKREIKKQEEHEDWLSTLSETDRLLARSTPVHQTELAKMTEEEQLASRWLANTFRVPRNEPQRKAADVARKIKKQKEHEEWLSTLTEADKKLARPKPLHETSLNRMTKQQQLDSRWLANTFRAPKWKKPLA